MNAIITVVGKDTVGIIARVSSLLAKEKVNILDISQTTMRGMFTMMMLVDLTEAASPNHVLTEKLEEIGKEMNLTIRMQKEDLFQSMHRI